MADNRSLESRVHKWIDPVEVIEYEVSDGPEGLKVIPDMMRGPLCREILRLSEELNFARAALDILRRSALV